MEISTIIQILWRRKWVILATVILTLGVAAFVIYQIPASYRTTVTMRAHTPNNDAWTNEDYADRLNNTYIHMIRSPLVMNELMTRLGLEEEPDVTLRSVPSTEILELSVEGRDPEVANVLADILVERNRELYYGNVASASDTILAEMLDAETALDELLEEYSIEASQMDNPVVLSQLSTTEQRRLEMAKQRITALQAQYQPMLLDEMIQESALFVVGPAEPPEGPYAPNRLMLLGLGALAGIVAALALAFVFENLDDTLYATDQMENITHLPVLAKVPYHRRLRTVESLEGEGYQLEVFRQLRTNLLVSTPGDRSLQTLMIASATPKEGKSTISSHLAAVFAKTERKVLLLDGDLRRPTLHKLYDLPQKGSLSDILLGIVPLSEALQFHEPSKVWVLSFIPEASSNATELLGSSQMSALMTQLKQDFDLIIIDTPALTAVADALELEPYADGLVVIVTRGRSHRRTVRLAMNQLHRTKARLLGMVVNFSERARQVDYYRANDIKPLAGIRTTQTQEIVTKK